MSCFFANSLKKQYAICHCYLDVVAQILNVSDIHAPGETT